LKPDSKENTKISYVQVRLSERERKQVKTTAEKLEVSMSELIRQLIKDKHTEVQGQLSMFKKGK
jgi:hypothetical protein